MSWEAVPASARHHHRRRRPGADIAVAGRSPERAAVLRLAGDGRPTTTVLRLLTAVAGTAIVLGAPDGTPQLPRTFRAFLRTIADHRRDDYL
ncbi:hypothetical protein ACFWAY_22620 [Rhodococcus sp. NPDC059968]|uniref:hypothetical protein n=1 Tax=Rhodococcus sp. NPDC059968 TaxID=3347017 RepID=UPI00366B37E6